MRNWGIIITLFYSVVLVFLLLPLFLYLDHHFYSWLRDRDATLAYGEVLKELLGFAPGEWDVSLLSYRAWIGILIAGQASLLFLSVDTSWRRNRPRQHVLATSLLAGLLTGLLAFFYVCSAVLIVYGDSADTFPYIPFDFSRMILGANGGIFAWWLGLWCFWGALFYWYYRNSEGIVSMAVSWLLAGSVLELLIAVPAHVIVRHRDDCSAPIVTGWGIVTGIAVMLLCFGPGVLALYKRRIDGYREGTAR